MLITQILLPGSCDVHLNQNWEPMQLNVMNPMLDSHNGPTVNQYVSHEFYFIYFIVYLFQYHWLLIYRWQVDFYYDFLRFSQFIIDSLIVSLAPQKVFFSNKSLFFNSTSLQSYFITKFSIKVIKTNPYPSIYFI